MSKITTLHVPHAFLYISWPSLHDQDVKLPNFNWAARDMRAEIELRVSGGTALVQV